MQSGMFGGQGAADGPDGPDASADDKDGGGDAGGSENIYGDVDGDGVEFGGQVCVCVCVLVVLEG